MTSILASPNINEDESDYAKFSKKIPSLKLPIKINCWSTGKYHHDPKIRNIPDSVFIKYGIELREEFGARILGKFPKTENYIAILYLAVNSGTQYEPILLTIDSGGKIISREPLFRNYCGQINHGHLCNSYVEIKKDQSIIVTNIDMYYQLDSLGNKIFTDTTENINYISIDEHGIIVERK